MTAATFFAFLTVLTDGTWLLSASLVVLILAAVAVVHVRDRRRARRRQQQDWRELEPPLRAGQLVRDVLGDEADRMTENWERKQDGGR